MSSNGEREGDLDSDEGREGRAEKHESKLADVSFPEDAPDELSYAVRKIEAAYGVNEDLSGNEVIEAADGKFTFGTRRGIIEERGIDVAQFRTPATASFLEQHPPLFEFSASGESDENDAVSPENVPEVYVAPEVADRVQNVLERTLDALNGEDMLYVNADMIERDRGYPVAVSLTGGRAGTEDSLETGNMSEREARRPWLIVGALAEPADYTPGPVGDEYDNTFNRQVTLTELQWREEYQEATTPISPTKQRLRGLSTDE